MGCGTVEYADGGDAGVLEPASDTDLALSLGQAVY
jgi:hypothetical protein